MLAAFTMVLSGTIVNVAVPDVMGAFGVGQSEVQLMSTAFMIAMTTGQLLNAWVVAVIGQRWGFMATLMLFTMGSFVAGAAENFDMVVLGRVMQGSAAGVIQPLVMVTVFQAFPEGKRGAALGVYVMGLVGAASVGPPLGGLAIEIFNSNIPIISAIGHETDNTIADFVSDLRASTPTAAAEILVPMKKDVEKNLNIFNNSAKIIYNNFKKII